MYASGKTMRLGVINIVSDNFIHAPQQPLTSEHGRANLSQIRFCVLATL